MPEKQRLVASCTPPTGDLAHNPGLCLGWESTQQLSVHRPALNTVSHTSQDFLIFHCIFSMTIHPPYNSSQPAVTNHAVIYIHDFFFLFCSITALPINHPPSLAVILLSIYESVSILLVSSVWSLDSTYE